MNIEIPYDKLKSLSNASFVALILDKNDTPIYRRDYSPISDPWFFSKKKKFLELDKRTYDLCDTIIFFPYYKDHGWGNKVTIKKQNDIEKDTNPSLGYLKNPKNPVNTNLIKQWIARGSKIPVKNDAKGEKNLIYFTAFGNNDYINLLKLLLKGMKNQEYRNFDILFITDNSTKKSIEKIKDLKNFNVDYHILKKIKDPVYASMQKLKIHEYPKIKNYNKILFLDMDILVVGDLSKIFEESMTPNILYTGIQRYELDMHNTVYHCINEYTKEHLDFFSRKGIFPFNAGQFLFLNTSTMRKHFKNIDKFAHSWEGPFFFEQSFLNTYFNVLCISDIFKFKHQFGFISINMEDTQYKPNAHTVFVHFMGSIAKPNGKLNFVKKHYSNLVSNKKHS